MRKIVFYFMLVLCVGVAGFALYGYFVLPPGSTVSPEMKATYEAHKPRILTHVFFAVLALATGPFQFIPAIRNRRSLHRKLGYVYFTSVFLGGLAGLAMSFISSGGLTAHLGFGALAGLWLFSGYQALASVRRRDFQQHEAWAIRSFALTFAAVTLRIYLGLFFALGASFDVFYPVISWLCWVPNLVFVEWFILPSKPVARTTILPAPQLPIVRSALE